MSASELADAGKDLPNSSATAQSGSWWRPPGWRQAFAWVGSAHGAVTAWRMNQPPHAVSPVPVVCVGNFVAGGAGKTPVAIAVAERLWTLDLKPVFLTRGYRGSLRGPLLVDEVEHSCFEVGDEPLLLAEHNFTVVSSDRPAGSRLATWLGADVVVMDDGFQNPSLKKDLSLVVVDGSVGIGNGLVLPIGPMRATLMAQLPHTDAIVVVNNGKAASNVVRAAARRGIPVVHARTEMVGAEEVEGRRLLAFAGLGRPEKFFEDLTKTGAVVVEKRAFPDHHGYSEADARLLLRAAQDDRLTLATTAKDFVRFKGYSSGALAELAAAVKVLDVRARFTEPARIDALLRRLTPKARPFHGGR